MLNKWFKSLRNKLNLHGHFYSFTFLSSLLGVVAWQFGFDCFAKFVGEIVVVAFVVNYVASLSFSATLERMWHPVGLRLYNEMKSKVDETLHSLIQINNPGMSLYISNLQHAKEALDRVGEISAERAVDFEIPNHSLKNCILLPLVSPNLASKYFCLYGPCFIFQKCHMLHLRHGNRTNLNQLDDERFAAEATLGILKGLLLDFYELYFVISPDHNAMMTHYSILLEEYASSGN
jgi:hypothetical protein